MRKLIKKGAKLTLISYTALALGIANIVISKATSTEA